MHTSLRQWSVRRLPAAFGALTLVCLLGMSVAQAGGGWPPMRVLSDMSGIKDWKAESRHAILIETYAGNVYRATFMGSCTGIKFTDTIGFRVRGDRRLDKFSSVILDRGQICTFKTLVKVEEEPETAEREAEPESAPDIVPPKDSEPQDVVI